MLIEKNSCVECGEDFTDNNVYSEAGWRETKITGMCECCYDEVFEDVDELDNHAFKDDFGDDFGDY